MSDLQNLSSKDINVISTQKKSLTENSTKKSDTENYVICSLLLLRISITTLGGSLEFCIVHINSGTLVMGITKI